mmetsp:Transcript_50094/g.92435  ORF Transcript_50094/g.92435 Transcript_50094/m.92435 type:complete len:430 (-) Transcript_50094:60-1349(-)
MELNWKNFMSDPLDIWWKLVIRPPRKTYELTELGNQKFRFGNTNYMRKDVQVMNSRGLKLECSHFIPMEESPSNYPCVIYVHGNSSSRLEAAGPLRVLLPLNVTVFCFDSSGSGRSEGDYISLGHYEEKDLQAVMQYLKLTRSASRIAVWGRSTGAVAAIFRAAEDPSVAACVLDSPFSSFRNVAEEMAGKGAIGIPGFMTEMVLKNMREEILNRASFDIEDLVPLKRAPRANSPALFAVAEDDGFVSPHHTERLYNAWGCADKKLATFTGGHNGPRPLWFLEQAAAFLNSHVRDSKVPKAMTAYVEGLGEVEWLFDVDESDTPARLDTPATPQRAKSQPPPNRGNTPDSVGQRLLSMGSRPVAEEAAQAVPRFSYSSLQRERTDGSVRSKGQVGQASPNGRGEKPQEARAIPEFGMRTLPGGEILTHV